MPENPLIAGIELGGTKINCILARGPDDIEDEILIPTTTAADTLAAVESVLTRWKGFKALGIASFGPIVIDPNSENFGYITTTPKDGWAQTSIAPLLRAYAGVPTGFHTDVIGAALAEARWGAAAGLKDLAYITVGTGVGVGMLSGGQPLDGLTHSEMGHMRVSRHSGDQWSGSCPFHGDCLEGLASGRAIAARAGRPADTIPHDDPIWRTVAHSLGQLLHNIVLTGVPRRIVMGGGVMLGNDHLLPKVRAAMLESLAGYVPYREVLSAETFVVRPKLADRAGALGAIILGEQALMGHQLA